MQISVKELKKNQYKFRKVVIRIIKEEKSIRSIRYEEFLKGIVNDLNARVVPGMSVAEKTDLDNLRQLYSTLAAWIHVLNNAAVDRSKVFYIAIADQNLFL